MAYTDKFCFLAIPTPTLFGLNFARVARLTNNVVRGGVRRGHGQADICRNSVIQCTLYSCSFHTGCEYIEGSPLKQVTSVKRVIKVDFRNQIFDIPLCNGEGSLPVK